MKRHKPPTLVSMWMLDVFCCALGCVTLLWLLKTREAGFALEETAEVRSNLADAQLQLAEASSAEFESQLRIEEMAGRIARAEQDRDAAARTLARTREELDQAGKKLLLTEEKLGSAARELALSEKKAEEQRRTLQTRAGTLEEELARKKTEAAAMSKEAEAGKKSADELQRLVRTREQERDAAAKRVQELTASLDAMTRGQKDLDAQAKELARARERIQSLEKQAGESSAAIIDLQGTKAKLADKLNRLEVESQNKFAGIALTGKRVVFLVDMSGSMEMVDERTLEPTKWATVRDTLIKVMRSLPDLEKFQVIVFSSRVMYLLPEGRDWLDYDRAKSPEAVYAAMSSLKPQGDTNLFAAFEECFKFRERGLDTIYLFSDGLPNSGPGLTEAQLRANLADSDKQTLLGKHVRTLLNVQWNRAAANQPRVKINSIGFFFESPDLGAFLWALARENDGSFVGMSKP